MTQPITIVYGDKSLPDGFGSQLCRVLDGIAYARATNQKNRDKYSNKKSALIIKQREELKNIKYKHFQQMKGLRLKQNSENLLFKHTPIRSIRLANQITTNEVTILNKFINKIIRNLNIEINDSITGDGCITFTSLSRVARYSRNYYNDSFLQELQNSYQESKPKYYFNNKTNIAIHIRRGLDINDVSGKNTNAGKRWVDSEKYTKLIKKIQLLHKDSVIHIFSWGNLRLDIEKNENIIYHIADDGLDFNILLDHFNSMVHADVLIVGPSSLSFTAGLFNKNKVIADRKLCGLLKKSRIPASWKPSIENIL